jgi:hypothetical protein
MRGTTSYWNEIKKKKKKKKMTLFFFFFEKKKGTLSNWGPSVIFFFFEKLKSYSFFIPVFDLFYLKSNLDKNTIVLKSILIRPSKTHYWPK